MESVGFGNGKHEICKWKEWDVQMESVRCVNGMKPKINYNNIENSIKDEIWNNIEIKKYIVYLRKSIKGININNTNSNKKIK